jgi:hypothetical protein
MKTLYNICIPVVKCSRLIFPKYSNNLSNFSTTSFHLSDKPKWGSKKSHRKIKLQLNQLQAMADPKIEEILAPLRKIVKEQVSYSEVN